MHRATLKFSSSINLVFIASPSNIGIYQQSLGFASPDKFMVLLLSLYKTISALEQYYQFDNAMTTNNEISKFTQSVTYQAIFYSYEIM